MKHSVTALATPARSRPFGQTGDEGVTEEHRVARCTWTAVCRGSQLSPRPCRPEPGTRNNDQWRSLKENDGRAGLMDNTVFILLIIHIATNYSSLIRTFALIGYRISR
jgi:hypothetical protein